MYVLLEISCCGTGKSNRQLAGKQRFGVRTVRLLLEISCCGAGKSNRQLAGKQRFGVRTVRLKNTLS